MRNKSRIEQYYLVSAWYLMTSGILLNIPRYLEQKYVFIGLTLLMTVSLFNLVRNHIELTRMLENKGNKKSGVMTFEIGGNKLLGFPLPDGMNENDFFTELTLIKGVYGNSSSEASKRLDYYYKHNQSIIGMK